MWISLRENLFSSRSLSPHLFFVLFFVASNFVLQNSVCCSFVLRFFMGFFFENKKKITSERNYMHLFRFRRQTSARAQHAENLHKMYARHIKMRNAISWTEDHFKWFTKWITAHIEWGKKTILENSLEYSKIQLLLQWNKSITFRNSRLHERRERAIASGKWSE